MCCYVFRIISSCQKNSARWIIWFCTCKSLKMPEKLLLFRFAQNLDCNVMHRNSYYALLPLPLLPHPQFLEVSMVRRITLSVRNLASSMHSILSATFATCSEILSWSGFYHKFCFEFFRLANDVHFRVDDQATDESKHVVRVHIYPDRASRQG